MAYIVGLVIAGLFFLSIRYFLELSKKQEILIGLGTIAFIFGAITFNAYNTFLSEKMLSVVTKFQQNKTVTCNGKDINSTNYDLSIGTYTFIGRENTPFYGEMISASSCE